MAVETKKIALLISASNFERQKNITNAVHQEVHARGNCILYVFSNYGVFYDDMSYSHGEAAIYTLLDYEKFDGCIIEGNLGSGQLVNILAKRLKERGIPIVTINIEAEDTPFLTMDAYQAACEIMEHLIRVHGCTKINLAPTRVNEIISMQAEQAYRDMLKKHDMPLDEKRIVHQLVSVQNGRNLYRLFEERGVQDAEAVICAHDVIAIGLCLEMQERGIKVPEDVKLCSLNYSTNSVAFRPSITGADRMDDEVVQRACQLLWDQMNGKEVSRENYYAGQVHYGESCGCAVVREEASDRRYQELILAKVEAGNQVSSMMHFNDTLEEVDSLEQLGKNIRDMLQGISCTGFFCCLNQGDLQYILNQAEDLKTESSRPYDDTMVTLTGLSGRIGEIEDVVFPLNQLIPVNAEVGDTLIFLPIHHRERDFGYMVFLNEFFPTEIYNYRICHESIGSSLENLRRQMVLRNSIRELDKLHMQDQMTGLRNRFALARFREEYTQGEYCLVLMDMDCLKQINDNFGHLSGNHALSTIADVLRWVAQPDDLLIRYGGDEFVMLSHNVEEEYWRDLKKGINDLLTEKVVRQKLPYQISVSFGHAVSTRVVPLSLEECMERADRAMYEDKRQRKGRLYQ